MGWKIEKQANGKFAIYSTRVDDYIVIDAEPLHIAQIYAEKGVKVYLASARAQLTKETAVTPDGEKKIEASRRRGATPKEGPDVPIGVTGFTVGEIGEK
ncbi:MAG: hypothetical protein M3041_21215 [Acidobacteriota bacterium]|nr:hypothetical protein [Acidobacteriota bacterium]